MQASAQCIELKKIFFLLDIFWTILDSNIKGNLTFKPLDTLKLVHILRSDTK